MALFHGSLGEFNSAEEDWETYTERLQFYFAANDVKHPEKQRAILLSACGATTYRLIRSLTAPEKPSDLSFQQLVKLVTDHYNPKLSQPVQRFKFHSRIRKPEESVAAFVAELKKISEHCGFQGAVLNDMLRDRLICGIADAKMQRRLLAEPNIDFEKALTLVQAMEAAERNTQDLQKTSAPSTTAAASVELHSIQQQKSVRQQFRQATSAPTQQCYRCGGTRHTSAACRFKEADCRFCGKKVTSRGFVAPDFEPSLGPRSRRALISLRWSLRCRSKQSPNQPTRCSSFPRATEAIPCK